MRVRRAPSQNPGDCLHVPTEQQLLFNGEIPRQKVAISVDIASNV